MIEKTSILSVEPVKANMWLLNSGIQNESGSSKGGFNSWFDLDGKNYSYVYSEITGYGVTSLMFLSEYFGDEFYIDKAMEAYKWLKNTALDASGGVKTRDYFIDIEGSQHYSFESSNLYAFDNGMVLYGIVNLYKKKLNENVLKFAVKLADFLIDNMRRNDGLFFAVYNSKTGEKTDVADKWSTQSGSYHAKLALGFTDLYDVTRDEKYKQIAIDLGKACLGFQESNGRFITDQSDGSTHLHPHSYSAEGLLYAGEKLGVQSFVDSAQRAFEWAMAAMKDDGGIPKKYSGSEFVPYYRSDILAQTLRLGCILFGMGKIGDEFLDPLKRLRKCLVKFQYRSDDRQDGGFYYGYTLDGIKKDHLNSWCTMFALQGLILYDENVIKRSNKNMECFI